MTKREKKILINQVVELHKEASRFTCSINEIIGVATEGPFCELLDKSVETSIQLLASILGDNDENLFWYIFDNDCGVNQREAGLRDNHRPIKTIKDLLWLIDVMNGAKNEDS